MGFLVLVIPVVIAAIVALIIVGTGRASSCPKCGKWWGMKEVDRKETGRQPGMKVVTRASVRKDAQGKEIERRERQEQVQVLRVTYDVLVRCQRCQHEERRTQEAELQEW